MTICLSQLDMGVLSKAMGHTNIMSTRNAFARYKKRWAFGNISTKTTAAVTGEADDGGTFPFSSCFSVCSFQGFLTLFDLHKSRSQAKQWREQGRQKAWPSWRQSLSYQEVRCDC